MARVMTWEQFRLCRTGTVFAFGGKWHFSDLLVLDEIKEGDGYYGFYAANPMWVESNDSREAFDRLDAMAECGVSYPSETSSTKYMSYDGDEMSMFFVLERGDWDRLSAMVRCPDDPPTTK